MSGFDFTARALAQQAAQASKSGQARAQELYDQAVRPERHANGSKITGAHLAAAIEEAHANFDKGKTAVVLLPPGEIVVEAPLPAITRPIGLVGLGGPLSSLRFTGEGQLFTIVDCGFGAGDAGNLALFGDTPQTSETTVHAGLALRNFAVTGDRRLAQDAFVFEGSCDNVLFEDVQVLYVRGHALYLGKSRDGVRGHVRESRFQRFLFRRCGDRMGSKPTVLIQRDPLSADPGADSCRMLSFRDGQIAYPQGHGIHIYAPDGATNGSVPINDIHFDNVRLHSQEGTRDPQLMSNGDLVRIEGDVQGVTGNLAPVKQIGPHGYALWLGPQGTAKPIVDLTATIRDADQGVAVGDILQAKLVLPRPYARTVLVEGKDFHSGDLVLIIDNDVNGLVPEGEVTLAGTAAVAVDFSQSPAGAVDAFFGAPNVLSVTACLDGTVGTLVRASASAIAAAFTPETSSTATFVTPVFDKVLIRDDRPAALSTGRWGGKASLDRRVPKPKPKPTPTPADTTAPTLTSPSNSPVGENGANLSVSTNEANGVLYAYLSTSATPPTATLLKAGTGATILATQPVTLTGAQLIPIATGLSAGTTYYAHFLHRDAAGNDSLIASATGFTTATPAPAFTTQPTISPTSGTVGTTFTANNGAATNAAGYTRRWLLSGISIGTGITVTPNAAGSLLLEVTATGNGGNTIATTAVTVAAAAPAPTPTPAPSWSVQPSISGTPTVGQTLTGNSGTIANGTVSARQWLRGGIAITGATNATYAVVSADQGTSISFRVTATGTGGTSNATSPMVGPVAAAPVSPTLNTLTGTFSLAESAAQGATAGTLGGITSGSTLSLTDNAGGRVQLSGTIVQRGGTALDFETATSHSFTVRETLTGATNTPRDTTLTLAVTNVFEQPSLAALTVNPTSVAAGAARTINLVGTAPGSTLTVQSGSLPTGMTLNSAARTITGTPTTTQTASFTLRETLADSANSPRDTALSVSITAAADTTAPVLQTTAVDGTALTLTYNEALNGASVPAASAFTARVGGVPEAIRSVSVSGMAVAISLAASAPNGTTVTLDYTPGANPIRDAANNNAAALSNRAVTNNTRALPAAFQRTAIATPPAMTGTTYYVSAAGSDAANGTSPATAWQTLTKAINTVFTLTPGSAILFRSGDTFTGSTQIWAGIDNTGNAAITLGAYDRVTGATRAYGSDRPILSISVANSQCIQLYGFGGWSIRDLILDGNGVTRYGIVYGAFQHVLSGCSIVNVTTRNMAENGVLIAVDDVAGSLANTTISGLTTHNNALQGLFCYGPASGNGFAGRNNRRISNLQINNSVAYSNGDSGFKIGGVRDSAVRWSVAHSNLGAAGTPIGGGMWCYDSTRFRFQFNECYSNKTAGTSDGFGLDIDGGSLDCVAEYNYCHANDGAGILFCSYDTSGQMEGCIVRHNILVDNARKATFTAGELTYFAVGSSLTNCHAYNNTLVRKVNTGGGGTIKSDNHNNGSFVGCRIANNIVQTPADAVAVWLNVTTGITFTGNFYAGTQSWRNAGTAISTLAAWQTAKEASATTGTWTVPATLLFGKYDPVALGELHGSPDGHPTLAGGVDLSTLGLSEPLVDAFGGGFRDQSRGAGARTPLPVAASSPVLIGGQTVEIGGLPVLIGTSVAAPAPPPAGNGSQDPMLTPFEFGINEGFLDTWGQADFPNDLIDGCDWRSQGFGFSYNAVGGWPSDARGYPLAFPVATDTVFRVELPGARSLARVTGNWVLTSTGLPTGWFWRAGFNSTQTQAYANGVMKFTHPQDNLTTVELVRTSTAVPFPAPGSWSVSIRKEGVVNDGTIYQPEAIIPLKALGSHNRSMSSRRINQPRSKFNSMGVALPRTLAMRTTGSAGMQQQPIEFHIDACNQADQSIWHNIMHTDNDDLVREEARIIATTLNPNKRVMVELSNEMWNFQFAQYGEPRPMALALGYCDFPANANTGTPVPRNDFKLNRNGRNMDRAYSTGEIVLLSQGGWKLLRALADIPAVPSGGTSQVDVPNNEAPNGTLVGHSLNGVSTPAQWELLMNNTQIEVGCYRWISDRTQQVCDICDEEMAKVGRPRVTRIIAWQAVGMGIRQHHNAIPVMLDWKNNYLKIDRVAIAPYWGAGVGLNSSSEPKDMSRYSTHYPMPPSSAPWTALEKDKALTDPTAFLNHFFDAAEFSVRAAVGRAVSMKNELAAYVAAKGLPPGSIKLSGYEFNHHVMWGSDWGWGTSGSPMAVAIGLRFREMVRHPRMYNTMKLYGELIRDTVAEGEWAWFDRGARVPNTGNTLMTYGMQENNVDIGLDNHRYTAVKEVVATTKPPVTP